MTSPGALWQQLQQAELVTGELPAPHPQPQPAFFLRLLLGVSGWLSALFFTAFITVFFSNLVVADSSLWLLGIGLCVFSIALSRIATLPLLVQQFIFACSLAGQAQIAFGVWNASGSSQMSATALIAVAAVLFSLINIRSQRSAAVLIACAAMVWLLGQQFWIYALPVLSALTGWLWLNQLRRYQHAAYLQPASTGLTVALWVIIVLALIANSTELSWLKITQSDWQTQLWIATALSSLLCLALVWQLINRRVRQPQLRSLALLLSISVALVNLKMPGLAPLCLLLGIGVAQTHTRLIWFNLVCLAGYLMLYYYNLDNSLLYKSVLMCVTGAALLILYGVLRRYGNQLISTEANTDA